ncbi:MAG: radical SAM/SPASM domain-containing protein [Acidobacteriia bacterium]|nr:radical SAM/SPASM domain-containing protein [Terriglobia bacterium]
MLRQIRLEASTVCQLKCPVCPTARGIIRNELGSGYLTLARFRELVDRNPHISCIELSNWGEVFLNPEIYEIVEHAYKQNVVLTAANGSNFQFVSEKVLEGLVRYKFGLIVCALDGASQETYGRYRVGGDFQKAIRHIEIINSFKERYRSPFPLLRWQFILFGHNERDIPSARAYAKKLRMSFRIRPNFDESYSPITNSGPIRKKSRSGVSSPNGYLKSHRTMWLEKHLCGELWRSPQINWDGRILGCCINYWGDFGNAFGRSLRDALNCPQLLRAKMMLQGKAEPQEGIPCATCHVYQRMRSANDWIKDRDILVGRLVNKEFLCLLIQRIGWRRLEPLLRVIGTIGNRLLSELA